MSQQPERQPLPGHILRAMLRGEIDGYEANRRAHEYFEHAESHGGDMNERLRAALRGSSPNARIKRHEAARDARGRFATEEGSDPQQPARASMNDLIREQLAKGQSAHGTLDLSHLNEPPDRAA